MLSRQPAARFSTLALGLVLLAGCALLPQQRTVVCDGVFPQWVLDAQGYDGGGCAEPIPLSEAPEGADWTPVCTGMCLCPQDKLIVDGACAAVSDGPWPSNLPYP